jgi:hypothetical protein
MLVEVDPSEVGDIELPRLQLSLAETAPDLAVLEAHRASSLI